MDEIERLIRAQSTTAPVVVAPVEPGDAAEDSLFEE